MFVLCALEVFNFLLIFVGACSSEFAWTLRADFGVDFSARLESLTSVTLGDELNLFCLMR